MASALLDANGNQNIEEVSKLANQYGSEFVNVFYKALDNKRHELGKYYADECVYIWNGNQVQSTGRQTFQSDLPESQHTVECYDVHPVLDEFNKTGHYMILISVSGSVKCKGYDYKLFFENFMLKAFESKWKIVSDCYRFAE